MTVNIGTMIGKHAHIDSRDWNYKDRSVVQPTNHNLDSPYHSISVPFVSAPLVSRGTTRLVPETERDAPRFIPSTTFGRRKPGYKFTTNEKGTGYYIDDARHRKSPTAATGKCGWSTR